MRTVRPETSWIASMVSSTVMNFKREYGISLRRCIGKVPFQAMTGEPRGFSRVAAGSSSYDGKLREPLVLAQGSPISIWVARGSWGLLSNQCRANRPHLGLCPETPCFSPMVTGISGLHSSLTRGVRPRLEWKKRNPLSSRVATAISWSTLTGIKGVKPPVEF